MPIADTDGGPLSKLERTAASNVKRRGWPAIVEAVQHAGRVLVTNHNRGQVVILSIDEYRTLAEAAESADTRQEAELASLRDRFDARLASLGSDTAGDRLRELMEAPATLNGRVKAGDSH